MATYKLLQDIEAEDHIIGNLSLRQFIYALIAAALYYVCFFVTTQGATFLLIVVVPPALFFTFFAFPFGKDQSTEVWALAKLRFYLKPRKRIWDQSGVKELVTITVPKKVERVLTNGLDQEQVRSRLNALANTVDSRGWAVKNVNINSYAMLDPTMAISSDRLVQASSLPQEVIDANVTASDDMMDTHYNPIAQQFDQMIIQSEEQHRQGLINQMNSSAPAQQAPSGAADYWFMNQAPGATATAPTYQPHIELREAQNATPQEEALAAQVRARNASQDVYQSHLRTLQPISQQADPVAQPQAISPQADMPDPAVTAQPDPAILSLANNNDLSVSTLAREASKAKGEDPSDNEVVISLR
jgi:hypothetical protein